MRDETREGRITVRANLVSSGLVVEAGNASFYFGPMRYRLWRAKRYLRMLDKYGASDD
jgi:hypothetical protein